MPILAREPEVFPDDLFEWPELGRDRERRWSVAHTLPRQEKAFARALARHQVPHYVPQVERRFRSPNGRRRISYVPMFPGYAFLYGTDEEHFTAMKTNSIARLLDVPDGEQLTFDLRQIRRLTLTGTVLTPEKRLNSGCLVRVKNGPFQGFEGRILNRRAGDRLLVVVNYLQQGVSVELDDFECERID